MIARVRRILAEHGPIELARRGAAWLGRSVAARAAAARRRAANRRALRLPRHPTAVTFPVHETPLASIVVPCFNGWRYTNACLQSLAAAWEPDLPAEVIVVDDASTDETAALLRACGGIRVVRREHNGGFRAAVTDGVALARGRYLAFLNNDAVVTQGWLRALLSAFDRHERTAAVASQLRFPDDRLAEAGAVIWRDGRGSNYGRGDAPGDERYEYVRDVDYGSAASLIVRRDAYVAAGGFSQDFAAGYYEDADLCFALRARGERVLYQPRSVVYHAEGVSYGSNVRARAVAQQERSRERFAAKWAPALEHQLAADPTAIEAAARRLQGAQVALVVDEHVPLGRDAGSERIEFIVGALRRRGYHVIFGSIDPDPYAQHSEALRQAGVEVMVGFDRRRIAALDVRIDLCWLCRPQPSEAVLASLRERFPAASIVYDSVDLHYLRLEREERATGRKTDWQAVRRRELALASSADRVVVTSAVEKAMLETLVAAPVRVVSVAQSPISGSSAGWEGRSGLAFVGNYAHAPNVDAVEWLCNAVMPILLRADPAMQLVLAGADPTARVLRLASANVRVPGYVEDLDGLLLRSRVFVAPLRYGAGVKGKIVRALAAGLPVVATPIGAEGIFTERESDLVATTADDFADRVLATYGDRLRWEAAVRTGSAVLANFTPAAVEAQLTRALD